MKRMFFFITALLMLLGYSCTNDTYHYSKAEHDLYIKDYIKSPLKFGPGGAPWMIGYDKFLKHDYKGAIEDCNKEIKNNPQNYDAYIMLGNIKNVQGDLKGSIASFSQLIRVHPDYSEGYMLRGYEKIVASSYTEANKDLCKAIELDSNNVVAYYWRGVSKNFLHHKQDALNDLYIAKKILEKYYKDKGQNLPDKNSCDDLYWMVIGAIETISKEK